MTIRACTFWIEDLLCGIAIDRVLEVVTDLQATPVPLCGPEIAGLINLRGRILTAVNGRRRLGLDPASAGCGGVHMIIATESGPLGLEVDRQGEVIELPAELGEAAPENIAASIRFHVAQAYRTAGALVLLLDPDRLLSI